MRATTVPTLAKAVAGKSFLPDRSGSLARDHTTLQRSGGFGRVQQAANGVPGAIGIHSPVESINHLQST